MDNKNNVPITLITSHVGADFDSFGSMILASKLYPQSLLLWPGTMDEKLREFVNDKAQIIPNFVFALDNGIESRVNRLIVVDTKAIPRLKHIDHILQRRKSQADILEITVFDHHPATEVDIVADYLHHELIGAATSLLVKELMIRNEKSSNQKIILSTEEATWAALGIYQDTGCFTYSGTTAQDFISMSYLCTFGIDFQLIYDYIHQGQSNHSSDLNDDEQVAYRQLQETAKVYNIKGVEAIVGEVDISKKRVQLTSIIQQFMEEKKVDVIFCLAQQEEKVVVSSRAKDRSILDVGFICRKFGGGGHKCAASATVKNLLISQVREELFAHLYAALTPVTIASIMRHPVTICSTYSITDAANMFKESGLKKLIVVSAERVVGIVDREEIKGLQEHDSEEKTLDQVMEREFFCLRLDSSLDAAIELLLRRQQRIIPIEDNQKLVGVVSRTDIIDLLIQEPSRFPKYVSQNSEKFMDSVMRERLHKGIYKLLKSIGTLADSLNVQAYTIGEFVRNILLNTTDYHFQIEILVEGNLDEFVSLVVKDFKATVNQKGEYEASVVLLGGTSVILSVARLEHYPTNVQLPVVELSSLKMELARRDFTVDAAAIQLNSSDFGKLIDLFNSMDDINNRTVNVLHHLSFMKNPSLILKAIRYEQMLGFKLGKATDRFIRNAISDGLLDKNQASCFFQEFKEILECPKLIECLNRLKFLGIMKSFHPPLHGVYQEKKMSQAKEALELYSLLGLDNKPSIWRIYFSILCQDLSRKELDELLIYFGLPEEEKQSILSILRSVSTIQSMVKDWNRKESNNISDLNGIISNQPTEGLLIAMAFMQLKTRKAFVALLVMRDRKLTFQ